MVCTEAYTINWLNESSLAHPAVQEILRSAEKKYIGLVQTKRPANTVLAIKADWKVRDVRNQKSITQSQHTGNED